MAILNSQGHQVQSENTIDLNFIGGFNDTIDPEELQQFGFKPTFSRILVEPIAPPEISESGKVVFLDEKNKNYSYDRPVYKVLRLGETIENSENRVFDVGDVVYSKAQSGVYVLHNLSKKENGSRRDLFMIDYHSITAVYDGLRDERYKGNGDVDMFDLSKSFTKEHMEEFNGLMPKEDYCRIGWEPVSGYAVVEQLPDISVSSQGIAYGKSMSVPVFRIVKMAKSEHPVFKTGQFVLINSVTTADFVVHNIKDANGSLRKLFLVSLNLILSYWPGTENFEPENVTCFSQEEKIGDDK